MAYQLARAKGFGESQASSIYALALSSEHESQTLGFESTVIDRLYDYSCRAADYTYFTRAYLAFLNENGHETVGVRDVLESFYEYVEHKSE